MNKLHFVGIVMVAFIMIMVASCQYKFLVEPIIPPPPPGDTTSFSLEIVPIWVAQNCTGCHGTGGTQPDLTADNAYSSITGMGLVNTDDPPLSRIYTHPLPDGNHYKKYTAAQATLLLYWIEEGARNN
ncbi:MAG: hypothetical protein H8E34_07680 [Bacteroidetes bacterium]|nr:hypothetical protein [Bacteroidota bacterium]MBL6944986.1 hypothetical protein [Bacteroidales bacterium]